MHADRAGIGEYPVDRDQRGDRREHRQQRKERNPGRDGNDPVLADRAVEKPRNLHPRAASFCRWRFAVDGRRPPPAHL